MSFKHRVPNVHTTTQVMAFPPDPDPVPCSPQVVSAREVMLLMMVVVEVVVVLEVVSAVEGASVAPPLQRTKETSGEIPSLGC